MEIVYGPRPYGPSDFLVALEQLYNLVPAAMVALTMPLYLWKALTAKPCVRPGPLLWMKLGITVTIAGVQMAILRQWWWSPASSSLLTKTSALAAFISPISLGIITGIGHMYSTRSWPFLGVFLAVTVIVDAFAVHTYFNPLSIDHAEKPHHMIIGLKVALLLLEQVKKQPLQIGDSASADTLGNEERGFTSIPLLKWAKAVLLFGFRSQVVKESLSDVDEELEVAKLHQKFAANWQQVDKNSDYPLFEAMFFSTLHLSLPTLIPRLLRIGLDIATAYLLRDIVVAVSLQHVPSEIQSRLTTATGVIYFGIAAVGPWHFHYMNRFIAAYAATLQSVVYSKTFTVRSDLLDMPSVNLMMTRDIPAMDWFLKMAFDAWAMILQLSLGIGMLYASYGVNGFIVAVPALATLLVIICIAKMENSSRLEWRRRVEEHVAVASNILAQLKDVNMLGLRSSLSRYMKTKHDAEIKSSMPSRKATGLRFAIAAFVETLTALSAIGLILCTAGSFSRVSMIEVFTAYASSFIVFRPLSWFIRSMSACEEACNTLARIQDFLLLTDNYDERVYFRELSYSDPNPIVMRALRGVDELIRLRRGTPLNKYAVQVLGVTIRFEGRGAVIEDAWFSIPKHKKTMIFGKPGSGKSLLARAMIGQMKLHTGSVIITPNGSVAYCSQEPWIPDLSLMDIIVGKNAHDSVWLETVVWICDLDVDIAHFPDGYATRAGIDGCNLSGGQKQRLSMARGLYSKAELFILDDTFSSLDKETSSTIRVRLFSQSTVLKDENITVIMTTSAPEHLVDANFVLEITAEGEVRKRSHRSRAASPTFQTRVLRSGQLSSDGQPVSSTPVEMPTLRLPTGSLGAASATIDRKYADRSLYAFFLGPAGSLANCLWLSAVFCGAVVERLPDIFVSFWMGAAPGDHQHFALLSIACLANPFFNLLGSLWQYTLLYPKNASSLYGKLVDTTCYATLDYITSVDSTFLLHKFCGDVTLTTDALPKHLVPLVWMSILLIMNTAFIFRAGIGPFPGVFLSVGMVILLHFHVRISRHVRALHGDATSRLSKIVAESVSGTEHIHAFQWKSIYLRDFRTILTDIQQASYHRRCIYQWATVMTDIVGAITATAIITKTLELGAEASVAHISLALLSIGLFTDNFVAFLQVRSVADGVLNGLYNVRSFVQDTAQEQDNKDEPPVPDDWASEGKVDFSTVTSHYKPRDGEPRVAIKNFTLKIEPGHIVGIAGRTGSGKSSIFTTLLHMLNYSGSICIDNREIKTIPRDVLRSRITVMSQSGLELKGSVRFNMDPYDPSLRRSSTFILTDEMMKGILRRVALWDIIEERGGLDAKFSDMKFSYSQKQLFQLGRAMLHKQMMRTKIILIDEGTSGMDYDTEEHIQRVMREAFEGCTVIMVSHRASLFKEADTIVTLEFGEIYIYDHDRPRQNWSANPWNPPRPDASSSSA